MGWLYPNNHYIYSNHAAVYMFLLLALYPSAQILLQKQLDSVFGPKKHFEWNADEDVPKLLNGYLGAVMSETLRLYHPVAWYARKRFATQLSPTPKARVI
jgi:cytochrome P450